MKPLHPDTPAKWYGAWSSEGLARRWKRSRAERGAIKAFGMEKYVNAATDLATHQPVMDTTCEDVLAHERGRIRRIRLESPEAQVRQMKKVGGKAAIAELQPARAPFTTKRTPGDFGFNFKWQVGLDQIANSKLGSAQQLCETVGKSSRGTSLSTP